MEQELVKVERANVVLRVPKDAVSRYMDQGFNVVDNDGNVIQASVPRDLGTLQLAYVQHTEKIKQLEAEIESLKASKRTSNRKKKED